MVQVSCQYVIQVPRYDEYLHPILWGLKLLTSQKQYYFSIHRVCNLLLYALEPLGLCPRGFYVTVLCIYGYLPYWVYVHVAIFLWGIRKTRISLFKLIANSGLEQDIKFILSPLSFSQFLIFVGNPYYTVFGWQLKHESSVERGWKLNHAQSCSCYKPDDI